MIKFADLETGNLFSGESPYIHWFPKEQSIDMIYTQPLCFISHKKYHDVTIEDSEIFSLLDVNLLTEDNIENVNSFQYYNFNKLKTNSIKSIGVTYRNYYVHLIYISASSKQECECIVDFYIDDIKCKIGADFYKENEILKINLSNRGIELPNEIQKAIYDSNLYEDKIDNILINRKWKELLSNYWDVIANKGSYMSLYNSLKWFEYGDLVELFEVWKNTSDNTYNVKSVQAILSDRFYGTLNSFAKTTYYALYCALEKPIIENGNYVYGKDGNPILRNITSKWSVVDLSLKLSLLGNFYETYFMPIHTELIHSTIEDIVYTDTTKICCGVVNERVDYINNIQEFDIEFNPVHYLDRVQCYVGGDTLFGTPVNQLSDVGIIGVQTDVPSINHVPEDLALFASQRYDEIGSVINFKVNIPLAQYDVIKRSQIFVYHGGKSRSVVDHKILSGNFEFNILCQTEGNYKVTLQFDSVMGATYTKEIEFVVKDSGVSSINIYKIVPMVDIDTRVPDTLNPFHHRPNKLLVDYTTMLSKLSNDSNLPIESYKYTQYIPTKESTTGPQLSHMLIFENFTFDDPGDDSTIVKDFLDSYYFISTRTIEYDENQNKYDTPITYIICVSKYANTKINPLTLMGKSVRKSFNNLFQTNTLSAIRKYREEYIFVPEYHKIIPLNESGDDYDINNYCIDKYTALCVIPDISLSKPISDYSWKFTNQSNPMEQPIILKYPNRNPLIAPDRPSLLSPGYYKVEFKYSLTNEQKINTIELDGAFIVK